MSEQDIRTVRAALFVALAYCECADGRRGVLARCAMRPATWDRLQELALMGDVAEKRGGRNEMAG